RLRSLAGLGRGRPGDRSRTVSDREPARAPDLRGARRRSRRRPRPRRLQGDVTRMTTELITDPTAPPTTAPGEATTEDASTAPSPTRGPVAKLTAASARVASRPLDVDRDTARLHGWLSHPRAHCWRMTEPDEAGVRAYLEGIRDSAEEAGWVGSVD